MVKCKHERYKDGHYMTIARIDRLTKSRSTNNIAKTGRLITNCEDCGEDISQYNIHRVWTGEEVLRELGINVDVQVKKKETGKDRLRKQKAKLEAAGQKKLL